MGNTFKLGKLVNGFTVLDNGNVGLGISNPASILHLNGIDAKLTIQGTRGTGGTHSIYASGTDNTNLSIVASSAMYFTANGSDRLVITSTGNLRVLGGGDIEIYPSSGSSYTALYNDGDNFMIWNNGSERLRINTSGNIGIATTSPQRTLDVRGYLSVGSTAPTVGGSGYADIHLRTFSGATNSPARIQVVDNWFDLYSTYTDGYRLRNYSADGVTRSLIEISGDGNLSVRGGTLGIDSGVTGTAGMFIKSEGTTSTGFTNVQAFHSSIGYNSSLVLQRWGGNVGIGTTTPSGRLHIVGGSSNGNTLRLDSYDNTGDNWVGFYQNNGTRTGYLGYGYSASNIFEINQEASEPIIISTSGSERMRIHANGNVSVGTTLNSYRMQIAKVSQAAPALMISGAYYGGPRIQTYGLDADSNAWMGLGTDMGGNAYEHSLYYSTNGRQTIGSYDGSTYTTRFYILANGNYWFSGSNLSDVRLKENIQPISLTASEKIALLNPCSYNMKDDLSITKYGFIAQEVQDVLPDLIRGGSDKHEDFMGLDYDGIFTITVKAVQEILTRLAALENK